MVKEYDVAPSPDLLLVVEPWLPAHPNRADHQALEAALSLAATVVREWCRTIETRVTLVVLDGETAVRRGPPSEPFARHALTLLADCAGTNAPRPIPPQILGRALGSAVRLVVSSRSHSPLAASLARSTGRPFGSLDPSAPPSWYHAPQADDDCDD